MKTQPADPAVNLTQITARLQGQIPILRAMGIEVAAWDHRTVTLAAPLAPNINHADTAFGGTISSLGILAGYALLDLALGERGISTRILIQKSTTDFRRPADGPMTATAALPPEDALSEFLCSLQKKRRARLTLDSQILCAHALAATHTGLYVAILY